MKQLQKKTLKSKLFMIIAFIVIGCGLIFYTVESIVMLVQGPTDLEEVDYTEDIEGLYVSGIIVFGELSKLVWIYMITTTYRNRYRVTGKSASLIFGFSDGSTQSAYIKSVEAAQEHLEKLAQLCPHAIVGYTDELGKMFAKDLTGFLNLRYNAATENINE